MAVGRRCYLLGRSPLAFSGQHVRDNLDSARNGASAVLRLAWTDSSRFRSLAHSRRCPVAVESLLQAPLQPANNLASNARRDQPANRGRRNADPKARARTKARQPVEHRCLAEEISSNRGLEGHLRARKREAAGDNQPRRTKTRPLAATRAPCFYAAREHLDLRSQRSQKKPSASEMGTTWPRRRVMIRC